jgi:hypothetical protein
MAAQTEQRTETPTTTMKATRSTISRMITTEMTSPMMVAQTEQRMETPTTTMKATRSTINRMITTEMTSQAMVAQMETKETFERHGGGMARTITNQGPIG